MFVGSIPKVKKKNRYIGDCTTPWNIVIIKAVIGIHFSHTPRPKLSLSPGATLSGGPLIGQHSDEVPSLERCQVDVAFYTWGNTVYIWSNYGDLTRPHPKSNGGLVREIPLFQGDLGWWNIIIWPDTWGIRYISLFNTTSPYNHDLDRVFLFQFLFFPHESVVSCFTNHEKVTFKHRSSSVQLLLLLVSWFLLMLVLLFFL